MIGMSDSAWGAVSVVVVVVTWFNLVQVIPARWRDVVAPLGVLLAAAIGAAWLFATDPPTTGLVAAVPWTLGALLASSTAITLARSQPGLRNRLNDRRIQEMSPTEFRLHLLVRIPLVVAVPEEILFRGVTWAVLADAGGTLVALLGSSVAFGLGHLAGARAQAQRDGHVVARWVATTMLVTTLAGLTLGALRWATGGVWAPVGVHAAVNATLAWGVRHDPEPTSRPATPAR